MCEKCQRFHVNNVPWSTIKYTVDDCKYELFLPEFIVKQQASKVCEWLNQQNNKKEATLDLIRDKLVETEEVLNTTIRHGGPTGAIYAELELLETIEEEINRIWEVE